MILHSIENKYIYLKVLHNICKDLILSSSGLLYKGLHNNKHKLCCVKWIVLIKGCLSSDLKNAILNTFCNVHGFFQDRTAFMLHLFSFGWNFPHFAILRKCCVCNWGKGEKCEKSEWFGGRVTRIYKLDKCAKIRLCTHFDILQV